MINKLGFSLVLLMALLQGFYAVFAYLDPIAFSNVRGTVLASQEDLDWIKIYASRTLFISLIIALLLYLRNYQVLFWAALIGTVMPMTDAWLAYHAGASFSVVGKHIATLLYLLITSTLLALIIKRQGES